MWNWHEMAFLEVEFNEAGGEPRFSSARFVVAYSVLDITKGPWRSHQPHALFDVEKQHGENELRRL